MGVGDPYLYAPSHKNGSTADFNPRAYTQASYAASIARSSPRPKPNGPLIDFNKHPDSWMVVPSSRSNIAPMPASTRKKVVTSRWIQFAFRLVQLVASLGLFVCMIMIKGIQSTQGWIMRIPPAFDAILDIYAIYHLIRSSHSRPAGSAASYHFFALTMDGGLIPFYIYTSMSAYSNHMQVTGTDGRWITFFQNDGTTNLILECAWLGATALAGLHLFSAILDILLVVWFRKISELPPDMNPLHADLQKTVSNHTCSNSNISTSNMSNKEKHMSTATVTSLGSSEIPPGYAIPSPSGRQLPFFRSRNDAEMTYSPHTQDSARQARDAATGPGNIYKQDSPSQKNLMSPTTESRAGSSLGVHSPYIGHRFPFPPGQDRNTFYASRPDSQERSKSTSHGPQAAQDSRAAKKAQSKSLLQERENWYVLDDSSDLGSPKRGRSPQPDERRRSPAPAVPPKNEDRYLVAYNDANKENHKATGIQRNPTMSSSVYSDDASLRSAASPNQKYYGNLMDAQQAIRYQNGSPVSKNQVPVVMVEGNRLVSRTGVDLADMPLGEHRQRNISGKAAEEGMIGVAW